ncbi:phospholipid hydroperoxide glutathione peroxidase pu [Plasmopara halstedii]|uniref:Phospholipid hydroperoxide glutathione peroxidase pu n=1 Tax=Plasmopara halstedii TaxID=4781 RepID=A0A0P1AWE9_PLAHL|nr:phospholipid hydroperoxide glutathione peroxidase pu [Plasmopara halstedii]CEG46559.1 phospholipid hydroperoxide glutathione peroxidase pu [Plasmopara halstedii]|eukprot:XP_024582928.1 phospholipid hydroperoxide glutathione peroxidase pu [Plasmopara halstedii]
MSAAQSMINLAESAREMERSERELMEREPSFVTALSSIASPITERLCLSSLSPVHGRVFRRLQRFQLLPSELKMQSDMVAAYLLTPKVRQHVFQKRTHWWHHPVHLAKAGKGMFIQGRSLIKAILKFLILSHAANNSLRNAQQLAETLILSGFLSPVHEASTANDEPLEELYVFDECFYELVAPGASVIIPTQSIVTFDTTTTSLPGAVVLPIESRHSPKKLTHVDESLSVWAVTDGATQAAFVQRQLKETHLRTLFHLPSKVESCYAVINKTKHHSLVLFETDVGRHCIVHIKLSAATVEYCVVRVDSLCLGLRICTSNENSQGNSKVEILVFQRKSEQEQWLLALVDAGATFLETHAAILSFAIPSASIYSLQDIDAFGQTFHLSNLRGFVALLTNVSSGAYHTNEKQFLELVQLSTTYKDAGLKVVAFPSAQFGDVEFDTDEELVEYFQELYGVQFSVLSTRDVNGPHARDPMLFCKTKQSGTMKSAANIFIENNFVKFLVSRDGQVLKRFGPDAAPLSMESDIQCLLKT